MSDTKYCYPPNYSVLKNKLDLRDADLLERAERRLVVQRVLEGIPTGDFDLAHLKAIHRHMFQDIFDWAGEIRTTEISKGGSQFQFRQYIETGMANIYRRVKAHDYLKKLPADQFADLASSLNQSNYRVQAFEFYPGIVCFELPVCFCIVFVAVFKPCGYLARERFLVRDAPVKALAGQYGQLRFSHIEPASMFWRIVPLKPFRQAAGLLRGEGLIERGFGVRIEVVLNQADFPGIGEMDIAQLFQNMGIIDGSAPLANFNMAKAFKRREQHEQAGGPVALVFVVIPGGLPRLHGDGLAGFTDQLFGGFIETNKRKGCIVRAGVNLKHLLHGGNKSGILFWRDHPIFAQMRLELVFLSARPTVLK